VVIVPFLGKVSSLGGHPKCNKHNNSLAQDPMLRWDRMIFLLPVRLYRPPEDNNLEVGRVDRIRIHDKQDYKQLNEECVQSMMQIREIASHRNKDCDNAKKKEGIHC
jgi:hypothetical protein